MIGGLIFMSLMSTRHLAFFYTIGVLYIAIICVRCLKNIGDNTLDILESLIVNNKIICIILLIIIISFSGFNFYKHYFKEEYVQKEEQRKKEKLPDE